MQVRYDEGVAIHIDHEPCAVACEGDSEASAEEHIGQPLSPAKIHIPGADAVAKAEGSASRTKFTFLLVIPTTRAHHAGRDTDGRVSASAWRTRRGRRTWHVWKLVARESGDPTPGQSQGSDLVCIGKARSHSR